MSEKSLLFLHAITSLHPGSGSALGVIDLPVQRERHTQWPTIPGSSLKGVLREACRRRSGDPERHLAAFGPETGQAEDHAGALSVTDARILAFPVRSLQGVFCWVTCSSVLSRARRDLSLLGMEVPTLPTSPGAMQALCHGKSPLIVGPDRLLLEEFEFTRSGDADAVAAWIANATQDEGTQERIRSHLVVLHDDDFTHFVRHATEVTARIALDRETKTVKDGYLFYEEFLPPETLFYAVVFAEPSRRKGSAGSAADMVAYLHETVPSVLQIGANQTTGKGICAARLWPR